MTISITAEQFWTSIDDAWAAAAETLPESERPSVASARATLCSPSASSEDRLAAVSALDKAEPAFLASVREFLSTLSQADLGQWDEHCAQALYAIDTQRIHDVLDGSDDGFLYTRGFVVAQGKKYYELVKSDPETYGVEDAECESFCYIGAHVYNDKFGDWPGASVSRESCSNAEGWKDA